MADDYIFHVTFSVSGKPKAYGVEHVSESIFLPVLLQRLSTMDSGIQVKAVGDSVSIVSACGSKSDKKRSWQCFVDDMPIDLNQGASSRVNAKQTIEFRFLDIPKVAAIPRPSSTPLLQSPEQALGEIFAQLSGSGQLITANSLLAACSQLGVVLRPEAAEEMIMYADAGGSGTVSMQDFINVWTEQPL
eukprot:TRINITY_DN8965_c0_g1_i1.p1 TRINITY_DN8965_c0_g1~~TRINITY_DN8965_c0_g1_i1.p1  ORF type:complete len:189 (+),score=6.32 TRINITY_DN8965_c0_g1_i1:70-636(+)